MKDQNKTRKNQDSYPTSSKRLKCPTNGKTTPCKVSNVEEIFLRFPIIGTNILNQIDNKSLIKLIDTNRMMSSFIQNERQTWIREIDFYLDKTNKFNTNTDRNFVGISLQQVLHFDLEVKYYGEHFSKSNFYILVVRFAHSK